MKAALILLAALAFSGCATMNQPRETTTVVIDTAKPKDEAMSSVMRALATNGYRIRSFDKTSGILSTDPKQFSIPRGVFGIKHDAASQVQVIALDKGIQLSILEECRYDRANVGTNGFGRAVMMTADAGYSACVINDVDANEKLPEQDREIQNIVRVALGVAELPPLPPKPKPKLEPATKVSNPYATGGT